MTIRAIPMYGLTCGCCGYPSVAIFFFASGSVATVHGGMPSCVSLPQRLSASPDRNEAQGAGVVAGGPAAGRPVLAPVRSAA